MANTPAFASTIKRASALLVTQDTALTDPTTAQLTLFTAGTSGSKVFEIVVMARQAAEAAGVVRIFIGATSTTGKLYDEFLVTAVTGSNTALGYRATKAYDNFLVAASELVIVTTSITQNLNVLASYADF